MAKIDNDFWKNPPWGDGEKKYRLGLSPIDKSKWLNRKPNKELFRHKKNLLNSSYKKVIATTEDSLEAQKYLGDIFGITDTNHPDLIAELS